MCRTMLYKVEPCPGVHLKGVGWVAGESMKMKSVICFYICLYFQGRLERCAHSCEDGIRVKMTADTTDKEMGQLQSRFDSCVARCGDDTIKLLPEMFKKMNSLIEKEAYHKAGF